MFKKINLYLAKNFIKNFIFSILGFFVMFFLINLIDVFERVKNDDVQALIVFALAFLKTPQLLASVSIPAVLVASILTYYQLSSKSEITIIRNCGYSIWRVSLPFQISAFLMGILWITLFNFFEIWSAKTFDHVEKKYVKAEMRESIDLQTGIWLRQKNLNAPNESIIIVIRKIYKNSDKFANVSLWFFDAKNVFYKRIDAESMALEPNQWVINNAIINDNQLMNQSLEQLNIPTELDIEFVKNKILNNFDNAQLFSIFELSDLIKELDFSGLNSKKFKVYFHSQLNLPWLFMTMVLFATYFGICDIRSRKANLKVFLGIIFGLVVFIISSISSTLGSSGVISVFEATGLITIIYICLSILLIYRKESSGN